MLTFTTELLDWKFSLNEGKVSLWINEVVKIEKKDLVAINYKFLSDEELLEMNKHFLKHDYYTDVITFSKNRGNRLSGDIAISVHRVEENATLLKVNFDQELKRVIIHGVLHLCGYNDSTEEEKELMRMKESEYLTIYPV